LTDRPSETNSSSKKQHSRIESVSSLSKLESFRGTATHSRHDSRIPVLTGRKKNKASVASDTAFNAPISDRRLDSSLAPASFRELLAGIAENLRDDTPRQNTSTLTPSHFYRTDEMFKFIEKEMK